MVFRRRTRKRSTRLKKRWYVAAKTPFGSFQAGNQKRSLAAAVKSIVRADLEQPMHHVVTSITNVNTTIKAGLIYTWNPMYTIPIASGGTGQDGRTADEIHIDAIKFAFEFFPVNTLTSDVGLLVALVKSPVNYSSAAFNSAGLTKTDLFMYDAAGNTTGDVILPNALFDSRRCSILWSKHFSRSNTYTNQQNNYRVKDTIRLDQKFIYDTGTVYAKNNNLYFIVLPFASGATLGTTVVGAAYMDSDVIYKNTR